MIVTISMQFLVRLQVFFFRFRSIALLCLTTPPSVHILGFLDIFSQHSNNLTKQGAEDLKSSFSWKIFWIAKKRKRFTNFCSRILLSNFVLG